MAYSLNHDSGLIGSRPESAIVNPFTDVDDQIATFCTGFAELRKDFHLGLSLTAALSLSQMTSSVDLKRGYPYTFRHLRCLIIHIIKC